jgi:hypothetical protein
MPKFTQYAFTTGQPHHMATAFNMPRSQMNPLQHPLKRSLMRKELWVHFSTMPCRVAHPPRPLELSRLQTLHFRHHHYGRRLTSPGLLQHIP